VLAVSGALYALSGGSLSALLFSQSGTGELLLLGCAASWVFYTLLGRKMLNTIDSLTTTCATAITGGLMLVTTSLLFEGPQAWVQMYHAPSNAWFSVVALALGATALGYAWYMKGVQVLGAGSAAAYMALVPLFGILFSGLWLGEPITLSLAVGGAAAIVGMYLMNQGRQSTLRATLAGAD
jgi:drug/metabolite transporter (DMT)-like permease